MKSVILYNGRHGATKQYAQWLGNELQLPVLNESDFSDAWIDLYDTVIIGGSVYAGRWQMHQWLVKHAARLKNKKLFFFIVCGTHPGDITTLKTIAQKNIPADLLNTCPVFYLHGRLVVSQLSWSEKLLLRIGAWLTKDPVKKREMVTDFDDVKKEHLGVMIKAIRYELRNKDVGQPVPKLKS
jgi:menaquinone-dependent protoporphyrinogen IX oxidase